MAYTPAQLQKIRAAIHRAYSSNEIPLTWLKAELDAELDPYDNYLDTEQVTANAIFSAGFRAKSTANDRRTIDLVCRMARYLIANPQYIPVLRDILREIEDVS